jgi:uncharacterized membrane protein SirB2
MVYYWIKILHISTVSFNIAFFVIRFYWMLAHPRLVEKRLVRGLSQFNDTLLLIAGLSMAVMSRQYPLEMPWLTAKLIGLVVYIVFGSLALKRARTRERRILFGVLALITVAYILSIALYRTPTPWS